jgi:hypothetical protein
MKQLIISVIFTALLTATSFLCLADNQPYEIVESVLPPAYPFKVMPTPTYKAPLASTLKLGTFVTQLESTSLTEVLDTIKVGHIGHRGDATESVTWLCYSIHDAANPFRIWLMSGGIDRGKVGSIVARTVSMDENTTQSCPNLPTVHIPIKLEHDVWIATDENTARKT